MGIFGYLSPARSAQNLVDLIEKGDYDQLAEYKNLIYKTIDDAEIAGNETLLHTFSQKANLKAVKFLVEQCVANVNALGSLGFSPLEVAKGKDITEYLLIEKNASLPGPRKDGMTLLHRACQCRDLGKVEFLLKTCEKPFLQIDHQDNSKDTALHGTLHGADEESLENVLKIVRLLLENGASKNAVNRVGQTPLQLLDRIRVSDASLQVIVGQIRGLLAPDISVGSSNKPHSNQLLVL